MNTAMTIAYDPKPFARDTPENRNPPPGLREITDETTNEDESDEDPGKLHNVDGDWTKMYIGNMEENY